jgi:DNA repair exonuclease SbcCD ATPase subunit
MIFLRLRIANYRGIDSSEVKFGSRGITLIQGPNEIGKTSLREAVGLLFDYPDNSRHSNVKAICPVHQDKGPEIELQAESGPYAFTYFKRFYKKPETKLTINKPKPENHTGREAHERAENILRETLDIDIWKALTVQQGEAIHQPILTNQTSLSTALDKAAGGKPADPEEEGLFVRVRDEYGRYFTGGGSEKKELQEARKLQQDTEAEIADIKQQISKLNQDIERAETLQRELEELKNREVELKQEVAEYAASLEEIGRCETSLETARVKLESAKKSVQAARRDVEARQGLIDAVAKGTKARSDLEESCADSLSALNRAEEALRKAQTCFNEAVQSKKAAETLATLRRADSDYYTDKLFCDQLRERKERIDQARESAAKAEETLARSKIDSKSLKAIQDAERALVAAKAQLETGAPNVILRGLSQSSMRINDADTVLDKDEVRTIPVADRMRLTVPKIVDIEVTAGSSIDSLTQKVEDAQHALDAACDAVGVSDPDEARKAIDARREASRQIEEKDRIERENLRDLSYEQLTKKLLGLERSVPAYLSKRTNEPAINPDLSSAKQEWEKAVAASEDADGKTEETRESLEAARNVRDDLSVKHQEARIQHDLLAKDLGHSRESLDRARQTTTDDALETALKEAVRAESLEEDGVRSADASLKAKNPERVKALAETASGSLQTTRNQRAEAQTEYTQVQERLRIHGEEGLHEKLHKAKTRSEQVEADNRSLLRRAAAARLLFETIREERDKARRAYVAPLKERIENLGRLVFDESFQVDINEELLIASRTYNGVTETFDLLSGGTKEQLSLIFRLACSMIVAKDGGAPVIMDDALGYTDPDRLRLMGAVIAKAAKECQIVIFTCVPERYGSVGEATVVRLG